MRKPPLTPRSSHIIGTFFSGDFSADIQGFRMGIDAYCKAANAKYEESQDFSNVKMENTEIAGVPVRIYRPESEELLPCILYFTGSGFAYNNLEWQKTNCLDLTKKTGFITINIQARSAPESPFPASLEDGFAVLKWIAENGEQKGILPQNIFLCGFSSGGNQVAVLARWARDHKIKIERQVIIAGLLDCSPNPPYASRQEFLEGYGLSTESLKWFIDMYVPDEKERTNPDVSPLLYSGDLSDIAPATIIVGEFDPLHDECQLYAEKLKAGKIEVNFHSMKSKVHEFASCYRFFLTTKEEDPIEIAAQSLMATFQAETIAHQENSVGPRM